jgi:hypothetical protein
MKVIYISVSGKSDTAKEGYEKVEIPENNAELEAKVNELLQLINTLTERVDKIEAGMKKALADNLK